MRAAYKLARKKKRSLAAFQVEISEFEITSFESERAHVSGARGLRNLHALVAA